MFVAGRRLLLRPALAAGACLAGSRWANAAACDTPNRPPPIDPAVHAELEKLRPREEAMRAKWEQDEEGWHKLPPRAWPPVQPKPAELAELMQRLDTADTDATRETAKFDVATCLTFNMIDPVDGLKRYRELAAGGNVDAMVAVGIVLTEGIGRDLDEASTAEGIRLFRNASEHGHPQAHYELGCCCYLGSFPEHVPEDEEAAFFHFEHAAERHQHTSALFMLAELLREGLGCAKDEPRAVRLLSAAADRGHRLARQYVREYLDADAADQQRQAAAGAPSTRELARQHAAQLPVLPAEGSAHFGVFRGATGEAASLSDVLDAAEASDVVLLGECHDDPIAHSLEAYLLVSLAARRERVALSLEMFERDTQTVLDEYLAGKIREADLLQDARAWANYRTDYRPLVEFAKAVHIPVIAANAPRRYVGAVGRQAGALAPPAGAPSWPVSTYSHLPPLPLPPPSERYLEHLHMDPAVVRPDQIGFKDGDDDGEFSAKNHGGDGAGGGGGGGAGGAGEAAGQKERRCPYIGFQSRDGLLEPMLLWDASMAHSIVRSLEVDPQRLIVHVCGSFHCEKRLGIAEMVDALRGGVPPPGAAADPPPTKQLVVVMLPETDCHRFETTRHAGRGDFVILTDQAVARSHDYMAS